MSTKNEQAIVEIIIKGQQPNATMKEIAASARQLSAQLKRLPVDSDEFVKKSAELKKVNERLKAIKDDVNGTSSVFQKVGAEIKKFGVLAIAAFGFGWLTSKIQNIIQNNGKLSDSFADIQKTTGMSAQEVNNLNKALTQLDTRTATEELRKIAIGAGQMGIAKEDVLKFTAAVDKMVVSLGDEFSGGAEEVTKVFGGLRNVFTDIKSKKVDEDLLHIGNAVNVLAAAGIATGPVVTDFANRIGGVGIQLGLSSGQVLGLSATLQELNVSTERGGTAVSRILQKMTTHVGEFAQVANMDFKSFGELVNKDLYGAFLKVVEGAKKGGQSATSFGKILDDLGVDGASASEVISKLGGNTDLLKEKVDLASGALKGTSSILQEFTLKNNTLGADLDRLGKAMTTAFTGSALQNGLKNITRFLTDIFDKKKDFEKLSESWRTQKTLVENLSTSMSPLLKRHDELKEKTILTTDEQKELKSIVEKVSETLPIAVTQFNKYGEALDINTEKGRKFIEMEKAKLAILNRDAIKSYGDELLSVTKKIEGFQKTLNDPFTVSSSNQAIGGLLFSEGEKGPNDKNRNRQQLTNEQLKEIRNNLKLAQEQQKGLVLVLNELKGVSIDAPKSTTSKSKENSPAVIDEELQKKFVAQQKKALEEKQKAYEKFLSDVEALEFKNSERYLSDQQREVNEVYKKYRVLLAAAKTGSEEEKVILQSQKDELEDIDKKYYDKALKAKEEYQQKRRTLENSDEQNEIDGVIQKYDEVIRLALEHNEDAKSLEIAKWEAIAAIQKSYRDKEAAAADAQNAKKKAEADAAASQREKELRAVYDAFSSTLQNIQNTQLQNQQRLLDQESDRIDKTTSKQLDSQRDLYDKKIISEEEYNSRVAAINEQKRLKEVTLQREAAQKQKEAARFSAILSGAEAIMNILSHHGYNPLTLGILTALAIGTTAYQLNTINSAPVPQYAVGGFVNNETLFNSASGQPFIAGEKGAEWIAPNWMLREPVTANYISMLEAVRTNRSFASGGNTSPGNSQVNWSKSTRSVPGSSDNQNVLNQLVQVLQSLQSNGIRAEINYDDFTKTNNSIDNARNASAIK